MECSHGIALESNGSFTFFRRTSIYVVNLTVTAPQTHSTHWSVIDNGGTSDQYRILFRIPVIARMGQYPTKRFVDQALCHCLFPDNIKLNRTGKQAERGSTLVFIVVTVVKQTSFDINTKSHSKPSIW